MTILDSKYVGETITVKWNFLSELPFGVTISAPAVTIAVDSGTDDSPLSMLSGAASISSKTVSQKIIGGLPGVVYILTATATGSDGGIYLMVKRLAVLSNLGDQSAPVALTLTGTLPDGVVGTAYSSSLQIAGGVVPYMDISVSSGSAPPWIIDAIADDIATYNGIPTLAATYTFTARITDYAGYVADSAQIITIRDPLTITGTLGNAIVGEVASFTYTIAGGEPSYTASISSGAIPSGLSMDSVGAVTGTYTAEGTYSWNVHAVDSMSVTTDHADSNIVYDRPSLLEGLKRYDGAPDALVLDSSLPFTITPTVITAGVDGTYVVGASSAGPPFIQVLKYAAGSYTLLADNAAYPPEDTRGLDISPDGVWLATVSLSGTIGYLRIYKRTGDVFALTDTKTGTAPAACAWSPDGTKIAWTQREFSPEYGVSCYDLNTSTGILSNLRQGEAPGFGFTGAGYISWNVDGTYIAIGGTVALVVHDMSGSTLSIAASLSVSPGTQNGAHWSSDGAYIYTVGSTPVFSKVVCVYAFSGTALTRQTDPPQPPGGTMYDSSMYVRRNYLAVAQGVVTGNSTYIYALSGNTLTPVTTQPVTPFDSNLCVTWSKIP